VIRSFDARELRELVDELVRPGAFAELAILAGCLVVAWIVVRLMRGRDRPVGSVWFGNNIFDGVLFPVLALVLAYVARVVLAGTVKPAVFKVAIPVLISLVVIRLSVRVLSRTFPGVRWVRTVERSISWLAWIAVVLWVSGVSPVVLDAMDEVHWKVGATDVTLRSLLAGAITAGIVLVLVLWVSYVIERKLLSSGTGHNLSLRKIAANIIRVVLVFVGLIVALSAVGIDLTALSFLGGAIGVGLGFGLQKIAANYLSGFALLLDRSVSLGALVTIDGYYGEVTRLTSRYLVLKGQDGTEAIIPNEHVITSVVINHSYTDRRVRIDVPIKVSYQSDVERALVLMEEAARAHPRVVSDPAPAAILKAFADSGIDLELYAWIDDPEAGKGNLRSDLNRALLKSFNANGIAIPFPQREIRIVGTESDPDAGPPNHAPPAR